MIDYLEQGRTINGAYYAGELRKTDSRCSVLVVQRPYPHVTIAMTAVNVDLNPSSYPMIF